MPHHRLPKVLYLELLQQYRQHPTPDSWIGRIRHLAITWNLYDFWRDQRLPRGWTVARWTSFLRDRAKDVATQQWTQAITTRSASSNIAANYGGWSHVRDRCEMAEYVHGAGAEDDGCRLLFAVRSGTSRLWADQGRRVPGLQYADRHCRMCNERKVEDAKHVMTECEAFAGGRAAMLAKLPQQLQRLQHEPVFTALMGGASLYDVCPDRAQRRRAIGAAKAFWCYAFAKIDHETATRRRR